MRRGIAVGLLSLSGCWALLDIGDLESPALTSTVDGAIDAAASDADAAMLCEPQFGRGDGSTPATASCNGVVTDVLGSPTACGACGRDCAGGSCSAGACTAVEIFRDPGNMEMLGPGSVGGEAWATRVLSAVIDGGQVRTTMTVGSVTTGAFQPIATFPADGTILSAFYDPPAVTFYGGSGFRFGRIDAPDAGLAYVSIESAGFAVTADHIYVLRREAAGSIAEIDRTTHELKPFADNQGAKRFIVADDREVYWIAESTPGTGELRRRKSAGGGVEPLLEVSNPGGLALDAHYAYFVTMSAGSATVNRVRRDAAPNAEPLSTLEDPAITPTTWSALDVDGCSIEKRIWSRALDDSASPLHWILRLGGEPNINDLTVLDVPRCGGEARRALSMIYTYTYAGAGTSYYFTTGGVVMRGTR